MALLKAFANLFALFFKEHGFKEGYV